MARAERRQSISWSPGRVAWGSRGSGSAGTLTGVRWVWGVVPVVSLRSTTGYLLGCLRDWVASRGGWRGAAGVLVFLTTD